MNLTESGKGIAEMLHRRHRTILDFLLIIGVGKEIALSDACEIEHVVHKETIDHLARFLKSQKKK